MRSVRGTTLSVLLVLSVMVLAAIAMLLHQGFRVYVVHTGSMMPTYNPGDVVINEPPGELRPGQVITFLHSSGSNDLVTHRITNVADGVIHTKGDANRTADVWGIRPDQVQGTVVMSAPYVGYALVYLKQPIGLASVVTVGVGVVLLWQLFFPPTAPSGGRIGTPRSEPGRGPGTLGRHGVAWRVAAARPATTGTRRPAR